MDAPSQGPLIVINWCIGFLNRLVLFACSKRAWAKNIVKMLAFNDSVNTRLFLIAHPSIVLDSTLFFYEEAELLKRSPHTPGCELIQKRQHSGHESYLERASQVFFWLTAYLTAQLRVVPTARPSVKKGKVLCILFLS